jgi:hypothetical protein
MKTTLNVSAGSSNPQAWIAIQKNRQKIYGNEGKSQVYLKDGQEFQIELFNPTQTRYLVKFKINGNYSSDRGLILNPGQRYFLDRFIDEDRKLSFSTYEVEDSKEVKKAIEKNGLLEVEFYSEVIPFNGNGLILSGNYYYNTNPCFTFTGTSNFATTNTYLGGTLSGTTLSSGALTNTGSIYCSNSSIGSSVNDASIETGRVERGEKSNQSFENGYGAFNSWASHSTVIQIIPKSQKPVETHEIRNYCGGCGNRLKKQTWKFCPNCGEKF